MNVHDLCVACIVYYLYGCCNLMIGVGLVEKGINCLATVLLIVLIINWKNNNRHKVNPSLG